MAGGVKFDSHDEVIDDSARTSDAGGVGPSARPPRGVVFQGESARSLLSAPPAPPEQHRRGSLEHGALEGLNRLRSVDHADAGSLGSIEDLPPGGRGVDELSRRHRYTMTFGGVSMRQAYRRIRQDRKDSILARRGWSNYDPNSDQLPLLSSLVRGSSGAATSSVTASGSCGIDGIEAVETGVDETTPLFEPSPGVISHKSLSMSEATQVDVPFEALKEMFTENKINILFAFLPLAYWSHAAGWSDGSVFILNFLAMVPLAAMLGVFTEELAAHTNDVIGGLINATFGNAVELVVAIQALLARDYRVVQASLIGSVFSNLLLVLGMCFLMGGIKYKEQEFVAQGAVASIALLAFSGLALLMPMFFGEGGIVSAEGVAEGAESGLDVDIILSRLGAGMLILMYGQLLFFQLKTHVDLFEGDGDDVALIPFSWALAGLVIITAIVTLLSEWLVGSIDGFCEEFKLGKSFVGVIILPVVGNAVEHISAVSVAMKNKMDLAIGVALGSAVQIAVFVLPVIVVVGWFTGREMSLKFPPVEVYLYLMSVIIVSLCLTNERSNWLEGSLLVVTYALIAAGIYFESYDGLE